MERRVDSGYAASFELLNLSTLPLFCDKMIKRFAAKIIISWKGAFSMENTSENKPKKHICTGIVAHVDAGKTTLSEALLFQSGAIRSMGRVDSKNTVLDNFEAERRRGITIFSKQVQFMAGDTQVTLLDTPGHVDFATEMERTLQVLDYCILVVGGMDGVQAHTKTLWHLLEKYRIPVFLFINKMDRNDADRAVIINELKEKLSANIVCFDEDVFGKEETAENIAVCDDDVLEQYLAGHKITQDMVAQMIYERKLFPVCSGSALRLYGVDRLLSALSCYTVPYGRKEGAFGARVYKITRDHQGNRLTHLKVTSGSLKVRDLLRGEDWEEKVNQIRIYQGEKYDTADMAECGIVCAATGLCHTRAGQGLGVEKDAQNPVLVPVLNYKMNILTNMDAGQLYPKILELSEEDPQLNISWNEKFGEIEVKLMGEVQTEILKNIIKERFDVDVAFDEGSIVYRETIANTVEGVGHFEPLRHYAEVHLLLEPGEPGSGMQFETDVSEDILDKNWQRLILTHLAEKCHRGVLTGSQITDMKITLINGKAHLKHTEGGDFRQAVYRAVRHGLMRAENVLLEPYYQFVLTVPLENVGRALKDLDDMKAEFNAPQTEGGDAVITGNAPVLLLNGYQQTLRAYSKGKGSLLLEFYGYRPCHNSEAVIEQIGYCADADIKNPAGSVFCAHGAGFVVDWTEVEQYMHIPYREDIKKEPGDEVLMEQAKRIADNRRAQSDVHNRYSTVSYSDDKELQEIFRRTYGETKKRTAGQPRVYVSKPAMGVDMRKAAGADVKHKEEKGGEAYKTYLLVDGYNVIHANSDLEELLENNLEASRSVLMDVLSNYQGFRQYEVILVFDAYKVKGNPGEVVRYHNISVVYTKEAETADRYIERTAHEIGHKYHVTVVTSDGVEQVIIRGAGCHLMSSREFWEDVKALSLEIHETIEQKVRNRPQKDRNYLFDYMDDATLDTIEKIRLGKE